MKKLKLEVGKRYVRRDGKIVILKPDRNGAVPHFDFEAEGYLYNKKDDGFHTSVPKADLIREYRPKIKATASQVLYPTHPIFFSVREELNGAIASYPAFNSAHEGISVLKEEVDELWDEVKKKQSSHDKKAMRKEALQVAAMALRFVIDICDKK